jgi:hypothetical protein
MDAVTAQAEYQLALDRRAKLNVELDALLARIASANAKIEATHDRMVAVFTGQS